MIDSALLQLPAIPADLVTVAWLAAGAIVLLIVWEFATFIAYVLGLRDREAVRDRGTSRRR